VGLDGDLPVQNLLQKPPFSVGEYVGSHNSSIVGEDLNTLRGHTIKRRVCVSEVEMKNLAEVETRIEKRAAGATEKDNATVKGKIVEFAWKLMREGCSQKTIENYVKMIKWLHKRGANILDPESVKDTIALQRRWSNATKCLAVAAYQKFAEFNNISWKPPKYKMERKLPFIPLESEIDALIACCGKKTATILQLLKETGMRIGEAVRLRWVDVDLEQRIIRVNNPEKGGKPRAFKISINLAGMLNSLPRVNEMVFGKTCPKSAYINFRRQRKRAAVKLQNPRLLRITFHTLRHWKATMEYHKTRSLLHVMKVLGHRSVQNTLIYTQLLEVEDDEFHSATARSVDEARKLIESGFEYVCTYEDVMLFRKRK